MKTFEAVGMMVELEDGLTKGQIDHLLSFTSLGEKLIPFEVSGNTSTIIGFITVNAWEEHWESVESMLEQLCVDWSNEREDKIYTSESGLAVFVDCECKTLANEDQ